MTARWRGWRWLAGAMACAASLCACLLIAPPGRPALAAGAPSSLLFPTTTAAQPGPVAPQPVQIAVSAGTTAGPLPAGFLGFSIEFGALHAYLGRDPAAPDPVFLQLLTGIDQGHNPILRVGGNSTDNSWLPLPGVLPPLAVNYTLTGDWLATVRALVRRTGARLILGVNLAADDPQIAGAEARALVAGIGRPNIEALEIGNEPDLYEQYPWYYLPGGALFTRRIAPYPFRAYATDFAHWREILPDLPIAAGALSSPFWLNNVTSLVKADPDVSMETVHRYPLTNCAGQATPTTTPTLTNLLTDSASEGLAAPLAADAEALHAAHRTLRVDELNSASCEGTPGVSDTFGSSLWMLDTLFAMAAAGVDGVNIHTLPGAAYAPFSFTETGGVWHGTVNPVYYGMLMFAAAFPAGADLLSVTNSSANSGGDVKAYATMTPDGTVRTTIINEDATTPADVQLTLPTSATGPTASLETLTAPSLTSTTGVQLGGQSFADPTTTGVLATPETTPVADQDGTYDVSVPAGSAALLTTGG